MRGRGRGVVNVVGAGAGCGSVLGGSGGGEVGSVCGAESWGLVGGDEEDGGASLAGDGEAGIGFDLRGVLKGDLKGWERVFVAVFRRRRFEDWMGDMVRRGVREILARLRIQLGFEWSFS